MRVNKSKKKVVANLAELDNLATTQNQSNYDTLNEVQNNLLDIIEKLSDYATDDSDNIVNKLISGCAVLSVDIINEIQK